MIRRTDFIHAIGAPDEGFNAAMDRALLRISREEENKPMKGKIRLSVLAAILAAILVSSIALAVGANLFEYFGQQDERLSKLAPLANPETARPESMESEGLGTTRAAFNNAYYDGQSLIIAFTLENSKRYAAFDPTAEQLSRMEMVDPQSFAMPYDENTPGIDAYNAYQMAVQNGTPAGIALYTIYTSDHTEANDGIDLPPTMEQAETLADGSLWILREFERPLPGEAQNQDQLALRIALRQMTIYCYFDGSKLYALHESGQSAGEISTIVKRTEASFQTFTGSGEYNGVPIAAELQISAVHAELHLSADEAVFADPGDDCWYDALLIDENGVTLRTEEVHFAGDQATVSFSGIGSIPEQLTLYIGIQGEGEFNQEDFKKAATQLHLNPKE